MKIRIEQPDQPPDYGITLLEHPIELSSLKPIPTPPEAAPEAPKAPVAQPESSHIAVRGLRSARHLLHRPTKDPAKKIIAERFLIPGRPVGWDAEMSDEEKKAQKAKDQRVMYAYHVPFDSEGRTTIHPLRPKHLRFARRVGNKLAKNGRPAVVNRMAELTYDIPDPNYKDPEWQDDRPRVGSKDVRRATYYLLREAGLREGGPPPERPVIRIGTDEHKNLMKRFSLGERWKATKTTWGYKFNRGLIDWRMHYIATKAGATAPSEAPTTPPEAKTETEERVEPKAEKLTTRQHLLKELTTNIELRQKLVEESREIIKNNPDNEELVQSERKFIGNLLRNMQDIRAELNQTLYKEYAEYTGTPDGEPVYMYAHLNKIDGHWCIYPDGSATLYKDDDGEIELGHFKPNGIRRAMPTAQLTPIQPEEKPTTAPEASQTPNQVVIGNKPSLESLEQQLAQKKAVIEEAGRFLDEHPEDPDARVNPELAEQVWQAKQRVVDATNRERELREQIAKLRNEQNSESEKE